MATTAPVDPLPDPRPFGRLPRGNEAPGSGGTAFRTGRGKNDPPRTIGHYGLSYRQIGFGQPERDCIDRRRTVFIQDGDRCLLSDLLPVANCPDTTKQKCEYDGKYVSHNLGTK